MNILVVSYPFAPNSIVGAKRFSALSLYFQNNGVNTDVLSTDLKYAKNLDFSLTYSANIVRRTRVFLPPVVKKPLTLPKRALSRLSAVLSNILCPIDSWQGWHYPALAAGRRMISSTEYDAIIVSGPPFSSFHIAVELSIFGCIPLILDYRDAWTCYPWKKRKTEAAILAEQRAVDKASGVVFSTDSLRKLFSDCFPNHSIPSVTITNGLHEFAQGKAKIRDGTFTIAHAGTLYGERCLGIMAEPLKLLKSRGVNCYLHHYGNSARVDHTVFNNAGLGSNIVIHEQLPHNELITQLTDHDVLVALSGSDVKYAIPYKVFDYVSTGRPILAITPADSELFSFITNWNLGIAVDPLDTNGIIESLLKLSEIDSAIRDTEHLWSNKASQYICFIRRILGHHKYV